MDFNGLIAFLGLAVAVFAVMPKHKKLDLKLRLNKLDLLLFSSAFLSLVYFLYLPVLSELGLTFDWGPWLWGFNLEIFTNTVLLVSVLYLALRLKTTKISRANIKKANELFEQLLFDRKFDELVALLDRHIEALIRVQASDSLRNRVSRWLSPGFSIDHLFSGHVESQNLFSKLKSYIAEKLEQEDDKSEIAEVLLLRLFTNDDLIQRITFNKPYLGIRVLKQDLLKWTRDDFINRYFSALIDDRASIYYFELNQTHTLRGMSRYEISKSSQLLYYLFKDVSVAQALEIYRPVGEKVCDLLENNQSIIKRYNEPLGRFHDVERQKCPIDNSFHFFNLMIIESLFQGIEWHMWLYYFESFSKSVIGSMQPTRDVDLSSEWPTPFHYLLYQVIDHLVLWLDAVQSLDETATNAKVSADARNDNASIPQSTAICLGRVVSQILESEVITHKFKTYILEKVLRFIRDRQQIDSMKQVCKLLENSLIHRGNNYQIDFAYLSELEAYYHEIDRVIASETEQFYDSLKNHMRK